VLDRYLARGGAVFALVDPRTNGSWVDKLRAWGADLGNDIVIDRALALFGRAVTPFAGKYDPENPITKDFPRPRNDAVMFHEARSVRAWTARRSPRSCSPARRRGRSAISAGSTARARRRWTPTTSPDRCR
jgi:hypothetical protein